MGYALEDRLDFHVFLADNEDVLLDGHATGDADTPREKREYTILSITLEDGTEVDVHDTQTLYRVCTSNFNATVPGSVFEGKTPVVPEADAPTDNEAYIRLLREEYAANDGYISVDTRPRGTKVGAE